ncbi:alpha/beta hydrolase [Roseimaritima ulvae]|uniref:Phospholipase/Carboxylesterase n=1 Tax=Roseimaritima ulvae TaxID=980254 RepID=A0A5B9R6W2_9BACT|nr:hypothetical protein [Roseimaritima ulvae]QEG42361.1 Phospholipase/Carboxylesterase [Roseimaritima ulvae]
MKAYEKTIGDLDCVVLDGGPEASVAVVVCHGYGAPGDDLVPFGAQWAQQLGSQADKFRFVFPYAPLTLAELGMPSARAWWPLNMQKLMLAVEARQFEELHVHEPPGLDAARQKLTGTIDSVMESLSSEAPQLVLGGFSQGAMLTMDTTLRGVTTPPSLLLQMSGTLICRDQWRQAAAELAETNIKIIQSHGTSDPILPFDSATALRDLLTEQQLDVQFVPFAGPHTVGAEMLNASTEALKQLVEPS